MTVKEELLRHAIDLAVASGKKQQNQESGFVSLDSGYPIYENFLFCLALFRKKEHEAIFEAKRLLERLLYFQQNFADVPWQGNFPLFLTDFPYCKEHLQAARCMHVLLLIQKDFHQIVGQALNQKLSRALDALKRFCHKVLQEVSFPPWARVLLAACLKTREALPPFSDLATWGDPTHVAELILAYQVGLDIDWTPLWDYLAKSWHKKSGSFIGPAYKVKGDVTLLDYFMGLFTGALSKKADKPQLAALQASLLQATSHIPEVEPPFSFKEERFSIFQEKEWAASLITGSFPKEKMYGLYPYSLVTGEHSLVIQPQSGYLSHHEGPSRLLFEIPPDVFTEEKHKNDALLLWFDAHKACEVFIRSQKATCFTLSDPVEIHLGNCHLSLSFTLLSGDGTFIGHIRRGSRIAHLPDIELCLRAVRGSTPCQLQLDLHPTFV